MRDKILGLMFALVLVAGCGDGNKKGGSSTGSNSSSGGTSNSGSGTSSSGSGSNPATECSELTKVDCEKADQIAGKTCLFMAKSCVEKTAALTKFMAADLKFVNKSVNGTDVWGSDHGESPDWTELCGGSPTAMPPITFEFKSDSDAATLYLDCRAPSLNRSSYERYDLKYLATTLDNGALLIKFDDDGRKVMVDLHKNGKPVNQLDFLTKTSWFATPGQDAIKGSSLLKYIGFYADKPLIEFKTEADVDNAVTYAKTVSQYGAGKVGTDEIQAITLIFNRFP